MNSRVSWSVDGIDPSVRERAEAAARRAGMSLNDWLNSTIGEPAPPSFSAPSRSAAGDAEPGKPDVADIHQRLDSITRQIEQISQPRAAQRRAARRSCPRRADASPASSTTRFRASTRGCRRFPIRRRPAGPDAGQAAPGRDGRARRQPRSIAPRRRSARHRWILRSPKSPRARTNSTPAPADAAAQRAASASASAAHGAACRWRLRCSRRPGRSGFFLAGTASAQDHQPDRGAAASRSCRAIDRRVPRRTRRNPPRHHRGDAAPGDRIDRERNPLAVAPHRRHPPERQRRPGAGRHRTRARRNPRSAALADAGRAARRLRRGDPQSRRQARPDPALERRSVDRAAARRRDRGAARHRLQRRLQRRAGAACPTTCTRCRPRSTSSPASTATAMPSPCSSSASPR